VVLKGESFYTIAKKYSTTIRAVSQSNPGVDPTRLKIGQKLAIPSASQTTAAMAAIDPGSPAPSGSDRLHTVKAGENLTIIARRHGVAVKDLQAANNLRTTQIRVGQKLRVPEKAASSAAADVIPPLTPASSTAQPTGAPAVPQ
jgi:LysM repeat protein